MLKKICICVLLLLMLAGCGREIGVTGLIETEVNSYYSEVSGKIVELPVSLGQEVRQGDILAVIDSTDTEYALEQARQTLVKAESALAQLSEGAEPEQVQQSRDQVTVAEQNLASAQAGHQRLLEEYRIQQNLFSEGAVSKDSLDEIAYQLKLTESAAEAAAAQLDSARQALSLVQKGTLTDSQIKMAEADVQQAANEVARLTDELDKYVVKADRDGRILSLSYTQGNLVTAGSALLDIAMLEQKYWIGYVPEKYIDRLAYDQDVTICSGDIQETARVSYIDIKNQYAPKDYQSSSNRNQTTVKVKCTLVGDSKLSVGQDAELLLHGE